MAEADAALPLNMLPGALPAARAAAVSSHTDTLVCMLAGKGCPKSSGKGPRLQVQQVTKGVVSEVVEATEEFFSERGEKWLRANCGGLLAKDESYGFLLTDLVVGKLAPRDASITLGEKMRKEHAKVKKKQADSKRSIGKLPIALRSAAIIDAARERADLLAEPASKELIELIPSALSCSSVQREQKKDKAKSEVLAPQPEPAPEPEPDLEELALEAELLEEAATLAASIAVGEYDRAARSLARLGPRPSVAYLIGADHEGKLPNGRKVLVPLPDKEREWRQMEGKRWDMSQQVARELSACKRDALIDAANARLVAKEARAEWEIAARERVIAAMEALSASNNRMSALEAHKETAEIAEDSAERAAVAERAMFHMQNEMHAMQAWGPDHASRPPAAVFDMRGPDIKLKSIDLGKMRAM